MSLQSCLAAMPHQPGCYFWKSGQEQEARILYIGKAKDLKKRVSQYFLGNRDQKTQALVRTATHIDFVATRTEVEALLLEARLIREHKPPFNIDLKENKRYAYIKLTEEPFPRLITLRDAQGKVRDLIGPFTDGTARFHLMTMTRKLFRLRACKTMPKKVCLYYHIGQCSGPCEQKISKEDYQRDVERARLFMKGSSQELQVQIEADMQTASRELRFEDAKRLRDMLHAVQVKTDRQIVAREHQFNEDVLIMRKQEDHYFFLLLHVKKGMIQQAEEFRISPKHVDEQAPIDDFIKSYYQDHAIPEELLLEQPLVDEAIAAYLKELKQGGRVALTTPKFGPKRALLDVAVKNIMARINQTNLLLVQLQEALRLPHLPKRIDAFDNSHMQGTNLVGACVQFYDGKPNKAAYQKFIMRTVEGNDDFASMREVLGRRYSKKRDLPDLILIDGGKGQLASAYGVLQELHLSIPVIGLAKRQEEVFVPGLSEPLNIDAKSEPSLYLQRIRNEVHRFVITFHRGRRQKHQSNSALDDIPGIGEKTRFALLKEFKSVEGIKSASDEELKRILSQKQLVALRTKLRSP